MSTHTQVLLLLLTVPMEGLVTASFKDLVTVSTVQKTTNQTAELSVLYTQIRSSNLISTQVWP